MNETNPPVVIPSGAKTCGMAIAGLVLGILSLIQCCSIVIGTLGIVFSCLAMSQIKKQPAVLTGAGMAKAGLIMSIVGIVINIIVLVIYWTIIAAKIAAMKH